MVQSFLLGAFLWWILRIHRRSSKNNERIGSVGGTIDEGELVEFQCKNCESKVKWRRKE